MMAMQVCLPCEAHLLALALQAVHRILCIVGQGARRVQCRFSGRHAPAARRGEAAARSSSAGTVMVSSTWMRCTNRSRAVANRNRSTGHRAAVRLAASREAAGGIPRACPSLQPLHLASALPNASHLDAVHQRRVARLPALADALGSLPALQQRGQDTHLDHM